MKEFLPTIISNKEEIFFYTKKIRKLDLYNTKNYNHKKLN